MQLFVDNSRAQNMRVESLLILSRSQPSYGQLHPIDRRDEGIVAITLRKREDFDAFIDYAWSTRVSRP